ncbi:MAG: hypothetical protein L0Z51_01040 [Candidatus Latescibacteria bacterium]|nr:hypothetical protein [Candidatus Latescibacterota bacterium]
MSSSIESGSRLANQHHLLRRPELTRREPIEVDAAGNPVSPIVIAGPNHPVIPLLATLIEQGLDQRISNIEDLQFRLRCALVSAVDSKPVTS